VAAADQPIPKDAQAAFEQAAVWCEERAQAMRERAVKLPESERRQRLELNAGWVQGCADTIRHKAEQLWIAHGGCDD
jgi:hypothetical protein